MEIVVTKNTGVKATKSTRRIMVELCLALSVLFIAAFVQGLQISTDYGMRMLMLLFASIFTAFAVDFIFAKVTKKQGMKETAVSALDSFPFISAMILTLSITAWTSVYAIVIGTMAGILIGKLLFGGFGYNIFNPAGIGRAVIVVGVAVPTIANINALGGVGAGNLITGATIMGQTEWTAVGTSMPAFNAIDWSMIQDLWLGFKSGVANFKIGAMGETQTILILALGIVLAIRKILDWKVLASYLGTFAILVFIGYFMKNTGQGIDTALKFTLIQLSIGGLMFGAVFMATDPVTMPNHPTGRIVYGMGLAFFTILIRFGTSYPEGVIYAILIMNMLAPSISRLFKSSIAEKKDLQVVVITSTFVAISLISLLLMNNWWGGA